MNKSPVQNLILFRSQIKGEYKYDYKHVIQYFSFCLLLLYNVILGTY